MKKIFNYAVSFSFGLLAGHYIVAETSIGFVLAGLLAIWLKLRQMEDAAVKQ